MTRFLPLALALLAWPAMAQTISGPAIVTDGDTIRVHIERLEGASDD